MIWNPWKAAEFRARLLRRIAELNAELRNAKTCVDAERSLNTARLAHNQVLTKIILESDQRDNFSVADLSML